MDAGVPVIPDGSPATSRGTGAGGADVDGGAPSTAARPWSTAARGRRRAKIRWTAPTIGRTSPRPTSYHPISLRPTWCRPTRPPHAPPRRTPRSSTSPSPPTAAMPSPDGRAPAATAHRPGPRCHHLDRFVEPHHGPGSDALGQIHWQRQ